MIEFLTLFLNLIWGVQPVEVAVGPEVAAVELRLDGETVGVMRGAPWRLDCDFGELLPHELVAVALDEEGHRLGEARQWINFGRARAEARLAFEPDSRRRRVRLTWDVFDGSPPERLRVRFNEREIPVDERGLLELPRYDPSQPQFLEAEVTFAKQVTARAELSFGGLYGERTTSELTAVPIQLPEGMEAPQPEDMEGWFRAGTRELPVFSVDHGGALIAIVRDLNLPPVLPLRGVEKLRQMVPPRALGAGDEILFFSTLPKLAGEGRVRTALFDPFPVSKDQSRIGLFQVLMLRHPALDPGPQHFSDALAAAAKALTASGRPRVLLFLADQVSEDHSWVSFRQVHGFLRALRVPLLVWTHRAADRPGSVGAALDASAAPPPHTRLVTLVREVDRTLDSQIVVWLEGRHLPQQIELTPRAPEGTRFAR